MTMLLLAYAHAASAALNLGLWASNDNGVNLGAALFSTLGAVITARLVRP